MERAFADAGYDASYGRVTVSNRPDLCEYQCNGALAAAKQYHCAPIQIAKAVAEKLDAADYSLVEAVMPGFINLKLSGAFLETYLETMRTAPDFGVAKTGAGKTIVVDYGGANVAKPLHIGHLRPAIIGEAMKRLYAFFGYNTIGDVHLGDWGLQMGLIIAELRDRQPNLPYFDPNFTGDISCRASLHPVGVGGDLPRRLRPEQGGRSLCRSAPTTATSEATAGPPGLPRHLAAHHERLPGGPARRTTTSLNVHFDIWQGRKRRASPIFPPWSRS